MGVPYILALFSRFRRDFSVGFRSRSDSSAHLGKIWLKLVPRRKCGLRLALSFHLVIQADEKFVSNTVCCTTSEGGVLLNLPALRSLLSAEIGKRKVNGSSFASGLNG
jgi:hypothetical protein